MTTFMVATFAVYAVAVFNIYKVVKTINGMHRN